MKAMKGQYPALVVQNLWMYSPDTNNNRPGGKRLHPINHLSRSPLLFNSNYILAIVVNKSSVVNRLSFISFGFLALSE